MNKLYSRGLIVANQIIESTIFAEFPPWRQNTLGTRLHGNLQRFSHQLYLPH